MWVKLTRIRTDDQTEGPVYVNLDRFDKILRITNEDGEETTLIATTLSNTEDDYSNIEVAETPEEIMRLAGVLVPP